MKRNEHDITELLFNEPTREQTFLDKVVNNLGPTGIDCYIKLLNRYICKYHYVDGKKLTPMQLLRMDERETAVLNKWYRMKLYEVTK